MDTNPATSIDAFRAHATDTAPWEPLEWPNTLGVLTFAHRNSNVSSGRAVAPCVPCTAASVAHAFLDPLARPSWDRYVESVRVVRQLDEGDCPGGLPWGVRGLLVHMVAAGPAFGGWAPSRDFCLAVFERPEPDGGVTILARSHKASDVPETEGCVRGEMQESGVVVIPTAGHPGHCDIISVISASYVADLEGAATKASVTYTVIYTASPDTPVHTFEVPAETTIWTGPFLAFLFSASILITIAFWGVCLNLSMQSQGEIEAPKVKTL
eukprot:m51a1_g6387 hypothetical protein (268) ;mRNA; f:195899-197340